MCPPIYHDFYCVIMLCTPDEYDFCDVDLSLSLCDVDLSLIHTGQTKKYA